MFTSRTLMLTPLRTLKWHFALAAAALAAAAAVLGWKLASERRAERLHFERDETELIVTNLAGGAVHLYEARSGLDDATRLPDFEDRTWLEPGNYFLASEGSEAVSYYPVPIIAYRAGPDRDGALIETIRPSLGDEPPLLLPSSPPFAYIPSGQFLLGERLNKQDPHYVWLTGYFVGAFEVTNAEFREFLNDKDGYGDAENWPDDEKRSKSSSQSQATALLKPSDADFPRFGQGDQPVVNVSWLEANAFCRWLTRKVGGAKWIFALPNEAEWEKAARGPDGFDYGLGSMISDDQARLYNWKKNPSAEVTVVGWHDTQRLYRPNRYGVYHMSGNVAEWTQSIARTYNRRRPYADDDRNRDDAAGSRVVRGGSWYSASIATLCVSYRESFQPEVSAPYLGFRVVARPLP